MQFTIVDAPEIRYEEGQLAGDILLNFYRDLGWDSETQTLDPNKVKTTNSIYYGIRDATEEICPDPVAIGMHMVNRGPSVDDCVEEGKVHLFEGWVINDDERSLES